jgi:hypothetical protein
VLSEPDEILGGEFNGRCKDNKKEATMLVIEPIIEPGGDGTAHLVRDPVLMKQFADDKNGLTKRITFTEEEWEAYNEKPYTRASWEACKTNEH